MSISWCRRHHLFLCYTNKNQAPYLAKLYQNENQWIHEAMTSNRLRYLKVFYMCELHHILHMKPQSLNQVPQQEAYLVCVYEHA